MAYLRDSKQRASTIRYVVPNLRYRWPGELKPFTDHQVAGLYEDFSGSDEYGNNDEKFPLWFEMLSEYPAGEDEQSKNFLEGKQSWEHE